jgi:Ca2+-transporting ATPase
MLITSQNSAVGISSQSNPHAVEAAVIAQAFFVNPAAGLNEAEVYTRRVRYGENALQTIKPRAAWRMLLDQFASLIVALLFAAVLVAIATSDWIDAVAILAVLILNALVGFATEWKAGRALAALRKQTRTTARVRREQRESLIEAADLIPGDILILNAGDHVPADARLLEAHSLRVEESALTGESVPVEKSVAPVAPDAPLAERHSMLYLGTAVVAGRALALVTATGATTELGHIGKLVASAPDETTPLKRRLDELGRRLVYLVLVIGVIVMLAGWWRGENLWMMVEVGISLAVAAVPEALPAVTTLILALGVLRLAREHALVRRLDAVETLGSTTVICTDKTGTLTENKMTVREYALADGRKLECQEDCAVDELLQRTLRAGVLCNEAAFHTSTQAVGDPTETALLNAAHSAQLDIERLRADFPKLAEIPFDATTQRMLTLHRTPDGAALAVMKGAPAVVLDACSHYAIDGDGEELAAPLTPEMRQHFLHDNRQMADNALRVLAFAEKRLAHPNNVQWHTGEFIFLGLGGMLDPPRAGVAAAIAHARAAGIRTVMLTGDQLNTARAIARELKLHDGAEPQALQARDLPDESDHARLAVLARTTDVFARVSPADKLRIVEALQQTGEIVAVTGDGVNDAPALKRADIGVAMGQRGTEVAKEAADLVLTDDNYATILRAVAGGRTIYANIIKFVHLMFSKNLAAVLVIFTAIMAGWPLPLLPLQILWVNLVTDVFPAMALALEPATPDVLRRRPRSPQAALLSRRFLTLILWQGVALAAIILAAYHWALRNYGAGAHARTIALFALIAVQVGHSFNCRSRTRSACSGLFRNPYVWLAAGLVALLQWLALNVATLSNVLHLTPLNARDWTVITLCVLTPIALVELTKLWSRLGAPASLRAV